jgi:TRAP-type C4-dicarboxylate transport system substrate-binding protein
VKRRTLVTAMAGAVALSPVPIVAQSPVRWDFYTFLGLSHPVAILLTEYLSDVRKRSNGELVITLKPAGELPFKPNEVVKVTGDGLVQMGEALTVFITGTIPMTGIGALPMLLVSQDEMRKALPIIRKHMAKEFDKAGVTPVMHFSWPLTGLFGSGKPVKTLKDIAGRKFRTISPQQAELLKRLGAASVSLATAEVAVAMDRGTVEGMMTTAHSIQGSKWDDLVKWGFLGDFHGADDFIIVNKAAYAKLSPAARKALDDVSREWDARMTKEEFDAEAKSRAELKGKLELTAMSKADAATLTEQMKDYWVSWAQGVGPDAVAMLREVRAAVGK